MWCFPLTTHGSKANEGVSINAILQQISKEEPKWLLWLFYSIQQTIIYANKYFTYMYAFLTGEGNGNPL